MTKNSRYLYINIYSFIYWFIYSLIYWVAWQSNIQFSLYFYILLYFLFYFFMYLAIFVCFSFYFGCIIIIVIFFGFCWPRKLQSAPCTPNPRFRNTRLTRHRSEDVYNAVAICPAAVSNRLKCSPNFPRKPFSNLMTLLYLCLEMSKCQNLFCLCSWWDIFAWAYYEIAMTLTLKIFSSAVGKCYRIATAKLIQTAWEYKMFVWNVKRFQKSRNV